MIVLVFLPGQASPLASRFGAKQRILGQTGLGHLQFEQFGFLGLNFRILLNLSLQRCNNLCHFVAFIGKLSVSSVPVVIGTLKKQNSNFKIFDNEIISAPTSRKIDLRL